MGWEDLSWTGKKLVWETKEGESVYTVFSFNLGSHTPKVWSYFLPALLIDLYLSGYVLFRYYALHIVSYLSSSSQSWESIFINLGYQTCDTPRNWFILLNISVIPMQHTVSMWSVIWQWKKTLCLKNAKDSNVASLNIFVRQWVKFE